MRKTERTARADPIREGIEEEWPLVNWFREQPLTVWGLASLSDASKKPMKVHGEKKQPQALRSIRGSAQLARQWLDSAPCSHGKGAAQHTPQSQGRRKGEHTPRMGKGRGEGLEWVEQGERELVSKDTGVSDEV